MGEISLKITRMKSGPKGGDQQIGAMLATNMNSATIMLEALKDETFFNKVKGSNQD